LLASVAGKTFSGKRDLYAALGYARDLTAVDYRARFERSEVAYTIVTAAPDATWRGDIALVEDEDPETVTEFEAEFDALASRVQLWSVFHRVDVLAGLGQYAVLLIGAPGALGAPLERGPVSYVQPFGEDSARITRWDEDPQSERFGLPTEYTLRTAKKSYIVHWSRVVHVAENALDDGVLGVPRLRAIWNRLDDLDKVVGGGSEAFWLRAHQGTLLSLDKDLTVTAEALRDMQEQVDEFEHGLRRVLRLRGAEAEVLGSDVADFSRQADAILTLIACGAKIPKRILLGSERGELASSQDEKHWQDTIRARRVQYAEPVIVRAFVDRLTAHGILPKPEAYDVRWPEIEQLDDVQRADVATKWAELNTKAGEVVVTGAEIRDRVLNLPALED
jgi:hypothetical protein